MLILGIETSCDETSAAIVENGKKILSVFTHTQIDEHSPYFGVVPELASRIHLEMVTVCVNEAMKQAGLTFSQLDAIAVANRPGLIGSLLIGVSAAKVYGFTHDLPIIPVNHVLAHLYAPHLEMEVEYPNIGLIVSGGHTMLTYNISPTDFELVGTTVDDAVGEAFDKIAKHLNLGYPGGPIIDKLAALGDENAYRFPLVMLKKKDRYNFSYSGLKTAVVNFRHNFLSENTQENNENIAASFQKKAVDVLYKKTKFLCAEKNIQRVILSGGVACNSYLRKLFRGDGKLVAYIPSPSLCTDNAAIIAGLAYHVSDRGDLSLDAESRVLSSGFKGKNREIPFS